MGRNCASPGPAKWMEISCGADVRRLSCWRTIQEDDDPVSDASSSKCWFLIYWRQRLVLFLRNLGGRHWSVSLETRISRRIYVIGPENGAYCSTNMACGNGLNHPQKYGPARTQPQTILKYQALGIGHWWTVRQKRISSNHLEWKTSTQQEGISHLFPRRRRHAKNALLNLYPIKQFFLIFHCTIPHLYYCNFNV